VAAGQAAGALDPAADPAQIVFELNAFMVAGNIQFVASGERAALELVRNAVGTRLAALET
jgi:tetracycline repressor-like protein